MIVSCPMVRDDERELVVLLVGAMTELAGWRVVPPRTVRLIRCVAPSSLSPERGIDKAIHRRTGCLITADGSSASEPASLKAW